MFEDEAGDTDETQRAAERVAAEERAERVARVIDSVRTGTYQVRSDMVANRLIDSMLRRPKR